MISILKSKNVSTSYKAIVFNLRESHYDFKSCSQSIEHSDRVAVIGNNILIHTFCTLIQMKTPQGEIEALYLYQKQCKTCVCVNMTAYLTLDFHQGPLDGVIISSIKWNYSLALFFDFFPIGCGRSKTLFSNSGGNSRQEIRLLNFTKPRGVLTCSHTTTNPINTFSFLFPYLYQKLFISLQCINIYM